MEMERAQKRVVIDAGHGGSDPGAVANGLREKDFTLEAANYIYKRLNELGIPAKLTRSTDETLSKTERVRRIMNAFGNDKDVIVLSNHINAGGGDGAEVAYALRNNNTLAESILANIAKKGQNIRKTYQRRLPSDPSKDYYFIHRETGKTEPLLIEYGFIDSPKDDVKQLQNNLLDYAEAVVEAVAKYAGVPYRPSGASTPGSYVVKKGDSLWQIAQDYNTTVSDLVALNNLGTTVLTVGQVLKLPSSSNDTSLGNNYVVQKGDSLWLIADKFGVSVNDLKNANNLSTDLLTVGQVLKIPTKSANEDTTTQPSTTNTYTVQRGDSLWSIAKKYNISVDELKNANNLSTNLLTIGQVLKIPTETNDANYQTYTVQKGDSLWLISRKYNVNVQDIIDLNNLKSNVLSIGQVLKIPN